MVMSFLDRFDQTKLVKAQLDDGDFRIFHELGGNGAACEIRKLLGATRDVLLCLHRGKLITPALRLNWNDVLAAEPINPHIHLIDFDLSEPFHGGPEMVLKRVGGDTEEDVDQPIVTHSGKEGLFVR